MSNIKEIEKTLKALANHRRLAILKYLKNGKEKPVSQIAEEINLSFKSTSKHMGILFASDIVDREQRGLQMFYRLASNLRTSVKQIISYL